MSEHRVVITGLGAVTPLGHDVESTWTGIRSGCSGIGPITLFDPSCFDTRIAGQVRDFDPTKWIDRKEARRMDRFCQFGVTAAVQAFQDAALPVTDETRNEIGVLIGSGIGGIQTLEDQARVLLERGPDRISPFLIPMLICDMASGLTSIILGLGGPNNCVVTACATGTNAIGDAAAIIRRGDALAMLAGGTEAGITPLGIGGFCAMKAMSTRNEEPERASRPFDAERDGFVMGEGAAVLVLEQLDFARSRGARILAEVVGYGMSADAYHMTHPSPGGEGPIRSMQRALRDADLSPDDVDYINAHGTSTGPNDKNETIAIKAVLGERAYSVPISSTKSMTGHQLGAAGAVEALLCVQAIRSNVVPPTINYENPDPDCDLDYVPNRARPADIRVAMSNSFGFGGHNATLIIRRYDGSGVRGNRTSKSKGKSRSGSSSYSYFYSFSTRSNMKISQRARRTAPSPTLGITARFKQMRAQGIDVIGFGAGEPDFDTPVHIKQAAIAALEAGDTKYTPSSGTDALRKAICDKLLRDNGLSYEPAEVIVSAGAKHTLYNIMQAVLDPGDEVVIPTPYWVSYPEQVKLADGVPLFAEAPESEGFRVTADAIRSVLTSRTRMVIVNSPSNPTGAAIDENELRRIAELAVERDLIVVSDEIYEKLTYDGRHHLSIASFGPEIKARTLTVNGFSKAYSMTGWRLGYVAGDRNVVAAMGRIQDQSTSNPTSFAQAGAVAALTGPQDAVSEMARAFEQRRNVIVDRLNAIPGIRCAKPDGAFYVFPNIAALLTPRLPDSDALAEHLLAEARVAVVPGTGFGAPSCIRLSYATSLEQIQEGINRLEAAAKVLGHRC